MRKKKKTDDRNYLEFKPERTDMLDWKTDENGKVTLWVENKGFFNKAAQLLLKKPRISYIYLDEIGSFVWPLMDGKRDVIALGELVKEAFGEKAEPLYPRLVKYFQILESYHFIKMNEQ